MVQKTKISDIVKILSNGKCAIIDNIDMSNDQAISFLQRINDQEKQLNLVDMADHLLISGLSNPDFRKSVESVRENINLEFADYSYFQRIAQEYIIEQELRELGEF
jgi:hypothetical protein